MNDYPPERVVLDIFTTCQDLRAQGMFVQFYNNSDSDGDMNVRVQLFLNRAHYQCWYNDESIQGIPVKPKLLTIVNYSADGYNYDALCAMSSALEAFVKREQVEF